MRPIVLSLAFAATTSPLAAQQATLTYLLGKDTSAIEQYTHQGNRIAGTMVQRAGTVVSVVRYEMTYGTTVASRRLESHGCNPMVRRFRTSQRKRDSLSAAIRSSARSCVPTASSGTRSPCAAPPWHSRSFVYGPTEALAGARRRGGATDSIPSLGLAGGPGFIGLEVVGGDTLRLRGAPYPMRLVFDANNRLQVMDGGMTTNKVIATRDTRSTVDIAAVARTMKPTGVLSARDVARGAFGPGGIVLVDYGRPMVRERTVWGGALIPFDSVWRAGANDATHLFTTRVLTFGETVVPPGSYTLWIQHTRNGTFLIVNRQTGQWGTIYDPAQDVGRVPMQMAATPSHVEEMTVTVRSLGGNRGAIDFAWGSSVVTASFTATTPPTR